MNPQSPNPTSMVQWETSSSLEHSCWACATKANSPKALHTCYGIHSMPCLAYHSTMHAIGAAHRCSACISGREVHEGRHRMIAQLLADYHAAEATAQHQDICDQTLQERPVNLPHRNHEAIVEDRDQGGRHESDDEENISLVETSSTVTSSDDRSIFKPTKAEKRQKKRAIKAQRSQDKAAKNQARNLVQVTSTDVARVNLILHGDQADFQLSTHPLATDKTIEDVIARNKCFVRQLQCHMQDLQQQVAQGRKEEKARKQHKRRVSEGMIEDIKSEMVISAVLIKLGIKVNIVAATASPQRDTKLHNDNVKRKKFKDITKNHLRATNSSGGSGSSSATAYENDHKITKEQTLIVSKLRDAIRDDLEKHENELKQTYIRAGAFFRYAGRAVFERMTEIASRIDVQTGEAWEKKLKRQTISNAIDNNNNHHHHEADADADAALDEAVADAEDEGTVEP